MLYREQPVLIVDDETSIAESLQLLLLSAGIQNSHCIDDARAVLPYLHQHRVAAVILDLNMPILSGEQLLTQITSDFPELPCIIVTAINEVDKAVSCLKTGAFDFQTKPIDHVKFLTSVKHAIDHYLIREENSRLKQSILSDSKQTSPAFQKIITHNLEMLRIFKYAEAIAPSPKPILITGETGTGKELFAKSIHQLSGRQGEFVAINVAGLDDTSFSDTLFGHVKGAYTGADRHREGAINKAKGGTLLLDEIGDLKQESQVKLLRVIQESEYSPLGSDIVKRSDVRIITCTNHSIETLHDSKSMRPDFFFRLCTHHISIPPLRNRMDDIPLLLVHLFDKSCQMLNRSSIQIPDELVALLHEYNFPGNIRELEGMVFDAISKHFDGSPFSSLSFVEHINRFKKKKKGIQHPPMKDTLDTTTGNSWVKNVYPLPTLKTATQLLVREAIERSNHNQSQAARLLGISRQALNKRISNSFEAENDNFHCNRQL